MSKIPLKYHKKVMFYTKYTHPTLICRGTDGRTDGRTENIYSIFRDKLLLLGEHGFTTAPTAKIRVFDDVRYGKVRYIGALRTAHYALRPPR